jgi:hypothetical protein
LLRAVKINGLRRKAQKRYSGAAMTVAIPKQPQVFWPCVSAFRFSDFYALILFNLAEFPRQRQRVLTNERAAGNAQRHACRQPSQPVFSLSRFSTFAFSQYVKDQIIRL